MECYWLRVQQVVCIWCKVILTLYLYFSLRLMPELALMNDRQVFREHRWAFAVHLKGPCLAVHHSSSVSAVGNLFGGLIKCTEDYMSFLPAPLPWPASGFSPQCCCHMDEKACLTHPPSPPLQPAVSSQIPFQKPFNFSCEVALARSNCQGFFPGLSFWGGSFFIPGCDYCGRR